MYNGNRINAVDIRRFYFHLYLKSRKQKKSEQFRPFLFAKC